MRSGSVIITMAGLSQRFKDAGFGSPKFMLDVRGRPMFDWALDSLSGFAAAGWKFTFVARADVSVRRFIVSRTRKLGILTDSIVSLEATTRGQAESAVIGATAAHGGDSLPLVIFNVDTFVQPKSLNPSDVQRSDGWMPCFPGTGSAWSFVKVNERGNATDVAEKQRISKWASVGLYGFRTKELFVKTYHDYLNHWHKEGSELFVAPLYKILLAESRQIVVPKLKAKDVTALGTPTEVIRFDDKFNPPGVTHFF